MQFSVGPVMLPAVYNYSGILVFLIIILLLTFLWKIWRTEKCYADLPTFHNLVLKWMYEVLINKPKYLSLTSVTLQMLNDASTQHEKEGIAQFWCFRRILILFGQDAVRTFSTEEASADKSFDYDVIKDPLGEGLITSNGDTWKNDRKMLNPVFHIGVLKKKIPIFNENAKIMVKKLSEFVDKPTADLLPSLKFSVFHNLCESILDVNVKETVSEKEVQEFFEVMVKLGEYITLSWLFPATSVKLLKLCTISGWKYRENCKRLRNFGQKILFRMMESFSSKSTNSANDMDGKQKSISPILLEPYLKDQRFTTKYVQDHVYTFVAAGSDTVIYTIMWCLFLLGLNKDLQQKAAEEVQSVTNEYITHEDLSQLEYLECIIKETLRLYPTVPVIARYLKKEKQCGKYKVPKDTTLLYYLYKIHRNPEIYPDPETFDPDRFRSANVEKRKWAHLPFAEGYRNCIGKKFAMMQIKVTLAYILRNYEITSLDKREDVDLTWKFLLMPSRPLRMRLTRRKLMSELSSKTEE